MSLISYVNKRWVDAKRRPSLHPFQVIIVIAIIEHDNLCIFVILSHIYFGVTMINNLVDVRVYGVYFSSLHFWTAGLPEAMVSN